MRTLPALLVASAVTVIASGASAQSAPPPAAPVQAPPAMQAPPGTYLPPGYAVPAYGAPTYGTPALQAYAPYGYALPGAIPAPPPPADRGTERRSPAMMITGFTMAGVGATVVAVGAFFFMVASSVVYEMDTMCIQAPCGGGSSGLKDGTAGPIAAMVIGGAMFAAGLPIGIYGATKKPRELTPQLAVGPTSAKLSLAF